MILDSLRAEHDALEVAAGEWARGEIDRAEIQALLADAIAIHFADEEALLFPALAAALPTVVESLRREHESLQREYEALRREHEPPQGEEAAWLDLLGRFRRHAEAEEAILYEPAEGLLGREELRRLQSERRACSCRGHYAW